MENRKLKVIVSRPDQVLWEGEADSLSAANSEGPFDVLPEHANFLTLVSNSPIVIRAGLEEKTFKFERAVLAVVNEKASIYADI